MSPAETESIDRGSGAAVDGELLVDFLDEACVLVRSVDRCARAWAGDPGNPRYLVSLLESLHTLKGGALLCGFCDICSLVHELEDLLAEFACAGRSVGGAVLRELDAQRGELSRLLSRAREQAGLGRAMNEGSGRDTMAPIGRMLPRLDAGVRLLARMLGKSAELHVTDIDLELDAGVLRRLVMAMENVLCDAVYHGIESPGSRCALGKAVTGRIDVRVMLRDGHLVVGIEDDGRGIDVNHVRKLARKNSLLVEDVELDDADCAQFVFAPGLSTYGQIRLACGRGMGLSAARTGISRLGGLMAVDFRPGGGARFLVRIPRAISIERAWTFSVRNDRYALLDSAVEEGVPVAPEAVGRLADRRVFEYSGMAWEFWFTGELLGYGHRSGAHSAAGAVLLLRFRKRRIALYADAVQDRRDIVVRAAGSGAAAVTGVSLATLLDDGSLVAMLNPGALLECGASASPRSDG